MAAFDGGILLALNREVAILSFAAQQSILWFFAEMFPYLALAVVVFFIIRYRVRNKPHALLLFLIVGGAAFLSRAVITEAIRMWRDRPRPFEVMDTVWFLTHEAGNSFPSGHAAFFFAAAAALWPVSRAGSIVVFGASFLMGLARIAGGIHWPSDIIAGAIIGIVSAWAAWRLLPFSRPLKLKTEN